MKNTVAPYMCTPSKAAAIWLVFYRWLRLPALCVERRLSFIGLTSFFLIFVTWAHAQTAVLEYQFNERASAEKRSATNTGSVSGNDLIMRNAGNSYANLHGGVGSGVSGAPGDLVFDNSTATGMGSGYTGGYASGSVTLGELKSFTLTGWFKTDGTIIANGATLIEVGGIKLSAISTDGRLSVNINGTSVISQARYNAKGEWVFFAISYDSQASANNLSLFVGNNSDSSSLVRFQSATLDGGPVDISGSILLLGGHYQVNSFDGMMDDVRVYDSVLSQAQLDTVRKHDIAIPETESTSVMLGLFAISLAWIFWRKKTDIPKNDVLSPLDWF